MSNGFINKNEFLTKATAEGLWISLESTIDLSNYLLNECNFIYVLTGKLNQDCLEKFFGIIRQVAGPNDLPATPTFLQLYRILSVYSPLVKAPKTGNCSISTVITLSDLKEIVKDPDNLPERIKKINVLKEKIDKILEDGHYDCDDIFLDHNYADSTSFECIVYYLAGREGVLVNLKSRGFLTNPDQNLFNILKLLETCFVKHANSQNVFEDTFEEFFKINNLKLIFPCPDHKSRVMSDLFTYYITMRMHQYTYIINQENKKNNRSKKKLSKLTND